MIKFTRCVKKKTLKVRLLNLRRSLKYVKAILSIGIKKVVFGRDQMWKRYFWDKLGVYNPELLKKLDKKKTVLIEANSGGEAFGIEGFCKALRKEFPDHNVVFATDNLDAYETLSKYGFAEGVVFFPWNLKPVGKRAIKNLNIACVLYVVRILYPSFIDLCKKKNLPQLMIDGYLRIQEVDLYNMDFEPTLANNSFNKLDALLVRTKIDFDNMLKIGVEKSRLTIAGSFKTDVSHALLTKEEKEKLKKKFGLTSQVIVAGSTKQGEEKLILNSYSSLIKKTKQLKLILAPRDIKRVGEVCALVEEKKLGCTLYSQAKKKSSKSKVIIVDEFGVLAKLYGLGTVNLLGNTFFYPGGGHNLLEPMVHRVPVVFGKYNYGYKEFIDIIIKEYSMLQIDDNTKLTEVLTKLLVNKKLSKEIGEFLGSLIPDKEKIISQHIHKVQEVMENKLILE